MSVCREELRSEGAAIGRVAGPPHRGHDRGGGFIGTRVPHFDIYVYQQM